MFAVCIIGYFSLKVINYGVIQFIGDPALSVRYGAVMQVLEFLLLGAVMVIFRTQPLPPFYGIGLNEINVSVALQSFKLFGIINRLDLLAIKKKMDREGLSFSPHFSRQQLQRKSLRTSSLRTKEGLSGQLLTRLPTLEPERLSLSSTRLSTP